jgi:hypothetical protein
MASNGTAVYVPRLARETEPCAHCGALLASDQRYCLSCGERRAQLRVPFPAAPTVAAAPAPAPAPPPRPVSPRGPGGIPDWAMSALFGLAGAVALALGIFAGVLIAGGDDTPAAATATPVLTAAPTAAAPVTTPPPTATVAATFTPDWPAGQTGWTVQLKTLPKDGTTPDAVAAAKDEATGQGAADVGALDADAFPTLDGGTYVIYSGVHTSKEDAERALSDIQANFPDAKVVEVSDTTPEATPAPTAVKKSKDDLKRQEQSQSPEDAQKNTRKAPPTVESEGTPPPADDKAPGGGSDATEIG